MKKNISSLLFSSLLALSFSSVALADPVSAPMTPVQPSSVAPVTAPALNGAQHSEKNGMQALRHEMHQHWLRERSLRHKIQILRKNNPHGLNAAQKKELQNLRKQLRANGKQMRVLHKEMRQMWRSHHRWMHHSAQQEKTVKQG